MGRTAPEDRNVAQGFVDHLNGVLNRTVSRSRLSAVRDKNAEHPRFDILRYVGDRSQPLELNGSSLLLVAQQKIEIEADRCRTVTYQYRLQHNEDKQSWLVRWEYFREKPRPDYDYPLAHIHVNATGATRQDVHALHFPTRRVPLELVLWHLIVEWGVTPLSEGWQASTSRSAASKSVRPFGRSDVHGTTLESPSWHSSTRFNRPSRQCEIPRPVFLTPRRAVIGRKPFGRPSN